MPTSGHQFEGINRKLMGILNIPESYRPEPRRFLDQRAQFRSERGKKVSPFRVVIGLDGLSLDADIGESV